MKTIATHHQTVAEAVQAFGAAHPILAYVVVLAALAYLAKKAVDFIF